VSLETVTFAGRLGDYAYFLLSSMAVLLATTAALPGMVLSHALVMTLVYLWARENQLARVSFFGVFEVQGFYLPFVLIAWTVVQGGNPIEDCRGVFAGHVYYFLATIWPRQGGPQLLKTPVVVHQLASWLFGPAGAAGGVAPPFARPNNPAFQGRGRRLNE